jgi:hypothetical protein
MPVLLCRLPEQQSKYEKLTEEAIKAIRISLITLQRSRLAKSSLHVEIVKIDWQEKLLDSHVVQLPPV